MTLLILYILASLLTGAVAVSLIAWMMLYLESSVSRAMLIVSMICAGTFISIATLSILFKEPIFSLHLTKFIAMALAFVMHAVIVDIIQNQELGHARTARKFFMGFLVSLSLTVLGIAGYLFNWYEKIQNLS